MKLIYLSEEKYSRLLNEITEIPFNRFYRQMVSFIQGLLRDPISTKPSAELCNLGLYNGLLRQKLIDYDIISKVEDIDEPYDEETHKQISRYHLSYKVHRNGFKNKIRKFYNDFLTK